MKNVPLHQMNGLSLHYYTVPHSWSNKGPATGFDEADYFITLKKAGDMKRLIESHSTIMDKYDKNKRIALVVDEWGNWFDVEPGTNTGFLYQQNSLRDALTAGMTLNIFNNHADRVRMANIAQTVNVLQAVILTNEESIVLTPTYHVFDLYQPHMDALLLPTYVKGPEYVFKEESLDALSVSASKGKDGTMNITIVNMDPNHNIDLEINIVGFEAESITGKYISSKEFYDYNSFDNPDVVIINELKAPKLSKGRISATLPAKSVVLLQAR